MQADVTLSLSKTNGDATWPVFVSVAGQRREKVSPSVKCQDASGATGSAEPGAELPWPQHRCRQPDPGCSSQPADPAPSPPCPKATPAPRSPGWSHHGSGAGAGPAAGPAPAGPGQIRKFPRCARPPPVPTEAGHVQHAGDAAVAHVHLGLVLLPALLHDLLQRLGHGLGGAETDTVSGAAGETHRRLQPGQRRDGPGPEGSEGSEGREPPCPAPPGAPSRPARSRPPHASAALPAMPAALPPRAEGQAGPSLPGGTHRAVRRAGKSREAPGRAGKQREEPGRRADPTAGRRADPADPARAAPPPPARRRGAAPPTAARGGARGPGTALRGGRGPGGAPGALRALERLVGCKTRHRQSNPRQKEPVHLTSGFHFFRCLHGFPSLL